MGKDNISSEYAVKDLYLAAFLQIKGMDVTRLEQYGSYNRGRNPVYFIFKDKAKCEELENIFWNGTGKEVMVNAKVYYTTVRDLRARVFSVTKLVEKKLNAGEVVDKDG